MRKARVPSILILLFLIRTSMCAAYASPLAEIPFELRSNYIVFQVSFEKFGRLRLLLDTGCQTTVLNAEIMDTGNRNAPLTMFLGERELIIGTYHLRSLQRHAQALGVEIDGIIGNDLFHNFTVRIDFNRSRLFIYDQKEIVTNPKGEDSHLEINPLVSSIELTMTLPLGKKITGEFVIDTGAPITIVLNSPLAQKYGILPDASKSREFKTQAADQTAVEVMTESIGIGEIQLKNVPIYVSTTSEGLFAVTRYAGLVGTGMLKNFNVIFDYKRSRLNLEKLSTDK